MENNLAEVIKKHRKAAQLSQIKLADMAGLGKTVIYDVEKGKESIQWDTLQKIFKVLNIRVRFTSPLMDNLQSGNEKS
jgi:transcriptional regulator with XRE-family HTH domain